jgi:hypothetical protein
MNGDAIMRPIREFDGFVFAITHEIAPIAAASRHLKINVLASTAKLPTR